MGASYLGLVYKGGKVLLGFSRGGKDPKPPNPPTFLGFSTTGF